MVRKITITVLLALLLIASALPAGAYTLVKTKMDINQGTLLATPPQLGQRLKVVVTVHVEYESPLPLNGFWLKIWFKKPDGTLTTPKWYDYTNEYIGKGGSKTYYVATGEVADKVGTWKVYVILYDKDKSRILNHAEADFTVVGYPAAYITIDQVVGYSMAAALVALAAWAIRRG